MRKHPYVLPEYIVDFSDYFKLNARVDDVANALGYTLDVQNLDLPRTQEPLLWTQNLRSRFAAYLPLVRLDSEIARREYIIAPILLEVALHLKAPLRSEFDIEVNQQLKGSLDYFIEYEHNFLVVEAKLTDLTNGFTQLVAEIIALDQWTDSPAPVLYGAVTFGEAWQFCRLDREAKHITQDIETYSVPGGVDELARILVGILQSGKPVETVQKKIS